jgi:hypothetical protein
VTKTSPADVSFALLAEQLRDQCSFAQGFVACALAVCSTRPRPYTATPTSASATRRELKALGLNDVPGPRSERLTAAQRRELEAKENARRMGFERGRFVG